MLLIAEIFLTIKAWNRGWGGWALAPWFCVVWVCFVLGMVTPVMTTADLAFSALLFAPKVGVVTGWTAPTLELVVQSLLLMDLPLLVTLAVMAWRARSLKAEVASD